MSLSKFFRLVIKSAELQLPRNIWRELSQAKLLFYVKYQDMGIESFIPDRKMKYTAPRIQNAAHT